MLNILCALHCEAKPLIQRFGLKQRQDDTPFPIFANESAQLAVCGIGKIAAAGAVGWLGAHSSERSAWLNIGIAGHAHHEIGHAALAHSITDASSSRRFYPDIVHFKGLPTLGITTVDQPAATYPDNDLVEMEASGFYQSSQKFSTVDLIHCLKIVSDNTRNPPEKIDKGFVYDLISQSLPAIEALIEQIRSLIPISPEIDSSAYRNQCNWSETEKHQLERLLVRWKAMEKEPPSTLHLNSSAKILKFLEHSLNELPLCFTPSTSKKK